MGSDVSNLDLLKNLTIVIPTYKRQKFILRTLQYWSGKDVTIIVIDGSEKSLDINILNQLKTNIKYIHSPKSYYERLLSVINLINSQYVMMGCDDEFYIPTALNSCLVRLSLDNQLITCTGRAIKFNWQNDLVIGSKVYEGLKDLNLDNHNPNDRIIKHFSNYTPAHIYGVCRTSVWKIAAQTTFSKEFPFFASMELQLEFILLFAGKTLVIPELLWLRSNEAEPLRGTTSSMVPTNKIFQWWYKKKNKEEKKDFLIRMEKACLEINKLTNQNYIPKIQATYELYIKHNNSEHQNFSIFFKIFRNLPITIQNIIRKIFKFFRFKTDKKILLIDAVQSLESSGVKVDFTEIVKIEKIINFFHKK
jgi:glycosyltransferase domain-containing protein